MDKRIVYTRFDGGVSICCPADEAIAWMTNGGFDVWQNAPRGFAETQIERQIARGINPDVAKRYARAAMFGGCTTAEALEIIRDRDCAPHGYGMELWDISELPTDRWFRNAWRRNHNGAIYTKLELAKPIQWKKVRAYVGGENKRRAEEFEPIPPIEVDWDRTRERIRTAQSEHELRQIWP